jgi:predicted short-subunit dehydrogenase-like oxidoreductase (DUF2520 family)
VAFEKWAVVGNGRVGRFLAAAGMHGPFGRGFDGAEFEVVVLAVPDGEIATAARHVRSEAMVGHCAGSLGVAVFGAREGFACHPLMTITGPDAVLAGAGAAIAGNSERARACARHLAEVLGMQPFELADADRAMYHVAASVASNFLVTLEDAAEHLMGLAGGDRSMLVPLVRAAMENWVAHGGPAALTGPIARGDEATVIRQRAALAERAPELLALFDALCDRTRALADRMARDL